MMKSQLTLKHHFYADEKLLNYFASKITLLNILQNVAIYRFKYSISHIMVIPLNDTFLYYRTNRISLCCIILRYTDFLFSAP